MPPQEAQSLADIISQILCFGAHGTSLLMLVNA